METLSRQTIPTQQLIYFILSFYPFAPKQNSDFSRTRIFPRFPGSMGTPDTLLSGGPDKKGFANKKMQNMATSFF